jgi:LysM domain
MLGRVGRSSNLPKSRCARKSALRVTTPLNPGFARGARTAASRHNALVYLHSKTYLQVGKARWGAACALAARWGAASAAVCGASLLLGACATPPQPVAPSAAAPAPVIATAAAPSPSGVTAARPSEAAAPSPPAAVAAAPAPLDVPKTLLAVRNLLDLGEAADAERDLQAVLQAEPQNREALSLLRQIREDPLVILGRESHPYRVAPGETLSSIAGRALKDSLLFYALARYNNIKVPRQVAAGQMIRVPGRALAQPAPSGRPAGDATASATKPVDVPASAVKPADITPSSGSAPAVAVPPAAASAVSAPRSRSNTQLIADFTRTARTCSQRQDPCCAVANWDKVLELDAAHSTAKLEKQKEQDRIERLRKQGGTPGC